MLNAQNIQRDIQASKLKYDQLMRTLEKGNADNRLLARKIAIMRDDVSKAERDLSRQKTELDQLIVKFKDSEDRLKDSEKETDKYISEVKKLEMQLKQIGTGIK